MAEPLKNFFDAALVRSIASSLHAVFPPLQPKRFVADCVAGLDALELVARGGHVAEVMRRHLPDDFVEAAEILVRSLGPELDRTDDVGLAPFRYLPHVLYVGRHGLHAKDHPDVAIEVCQRWSVEAPPGRAWIVGHALRSLVKAGSRQALETMGFASKPRVSIEASVPARVRLATELAFSFELISAARAPQDLLVDFAVHFVKANGTRRPKVFKLRRLVLAPSERVRLHGRVSFAKMTTRQHRAGMHLVEAIVNGVSFPLGEVEVHR